MNKEEGLNINISAPNLISVCVDTSDRGEFSGRLYQCYSEEPWCFENVVQLLHLMDKLYDCICYPQASTESRSFVRRPKEPLHKPQKKIPQKNYFGAEGQRCHICYLRSIQAECHMAG